MIDRLVRRLKALVERSETECYHEENHIRAREDEWVWYLLEKETGREYWSETDAAYIKLQRTEKHFVCLGCGHETTVTSAERLGGHDGLKKKSEMSDAELADFQSTVHGGAFANGFPDHRTDKRQQSHNSSATLGGDSA